MPEHTDDIFKDLKGISERILKDSYGLNNTDALDAANEITDQLRVLWGGQAVYLKKISSSRDEDIIARFDGRNHLEICRVFGISQGRLYQIIKKHRSKKNA